MAATFLEDEKEKKGGVTFLDEAPAETPTTVRPEVADILSQAEGQQALEAAPAPQGPIRNAVEAAGELGGEFVQNLATPRGLLSLVSPFDPERDVLHNEHDPLIDSVKEADTTPPYSKE